MVTRAYTTLGVGDAFEKPAMDALTVLDALVDEGEPILSAYRPEQDGPWLVDVLFTDDTDEAGRTRWLELARELCPVLPPFQIDALAERDWVAESQKALHPVRAGRFVVHGTHDRMRLPPSMWNLEIDAGRAFGTAHHATTKGCLIALERLAMRGPLGSVADVGTGTGVLAIAADRLGAKSVVASDIDDVAVRVARANARANRCRRPIRTAVAAGPVEIADTVIANILARPLIAMAGQLGASARRTLVLSGLRLRDGRRVRAAYLARGFRLKEHVVIDDWITLTLERRSGHAAFVGRQGRTGALPSNGADL
ncbi:50S ribosomal protein L11 methyltransferase [Acuticoccus mangrovi]|uniref:Ribosomal protein L11 methyltransferase n=1 Tax=Acuticoccus mangrovi TaxID=2796142 RepID=A0A934IMT9_9HYPH|nr:50S ribosomal protein L11 methyltransferase [Acuticoccus mangrovi]MBJ3775505.1 50S ribosomal protein L11 methyltransferase [Acuticoccus mangrovi]